MAYDQPFIASNLFHDANADKREYDEFKVEDSSWLNNMFVVPDEDLPESMAIARRTTSADFKITDASIGNSLVCNPYPQFTKFADVRRPGRLASNKKMTVTGGETNLGQGRYWSKAFDDNMQILYLEHGVPEFTSMFEYFARAVNRDAVVIANEGRPSKAYEVGKWIGRAMVFYLIPGISLMIWAAQYAIKVVFGAPTTHYYSMKPTMHLYWRTVNSLVNMFAAELGIINLTMSNKEHALGKAIEVDKRSIDLLNELIPGMINKDGYIDVMAIMARSQVLLNRQFKYELDLLEKGDLEAFSRYGKTTVEDIKETLSLDKLTEAILKIGGVYSYIPPVDASTPEKAVGDQTCTTDNPATKDTPTDYAKTNEDGLPENKLPCEGDNDSYHTSLREYILASINGGAAYAAYRVEKISSSTDTFSNAFGNIKAQEAINSGTRAVTDIRFSMAGGNLFGQIQQEILSGLKDTAAGAAEGFTFGLSNIVYAMISGGYLAVDKHWQDSNATFTKHTYKIPLDLPANDPITQLFYAFIPISMILAAGLPQSVGMASYASPFMTRAYLKGFEHITRGMIDSISITRGDSDLPVTTDGRTMGYHIEITIMDLSGIMPSPINTSLTGGLEMQLDADNPISRYVASLAGRDFRVTHSMLAQAKLRFASLLAAGNTFLSKANMASSLAPNFLKDALSTYSIQHSRE